MLNRVEISLPKLGFFLSLLAMLSLSVMFTQCQTASKEADKEDETTEVEEPKPEPKKQATVITKADRSNLTKKHKAKAKAAEDDPEKHNELEASDVEVAPARDNADPVIVVAHRTVYVPVPMLEDMRMRQGQQTDEGVEVKAESVNKAEIARALTEFDTPPMYNYDECASKKHPKHCTHVQLQRFFRKNIDYSVHPGDNQDHVEYATFVVNADGTVDDSSVSVVDQTPHCEQCAEETKRVVRLLGKWEPGTYNGQKVACKVTLPVRFHDFDI